jgi:fructose 1,6-bisphosphatase
MGLAPTSLFLACALVVRNLAISDAFTGRALDEQRRKAVGLAEWWREAETIWDEHKVPATSLSVLGQVDYMHKLSAQFPAAPIRVVTQRQATTSPARP